MAIFRNLKKLYDLPHHITILPPHTPLPNITEVGEHLLSRLIKCGLNRAAFSLVTCVDQLSYFNWASLNFFAFQLLIHNK